MNWIEIITSLASALIGGGLVGIFTIPEKKASAKLDNAERVIAKYEEVLAKYEKRISELETQVKELEQKVEQKDSRIDELEHQVLELQLNTVQRGKNGRFTKKTADVSK